MITVAQDYVLRMLGSKSAAGMKVLLMDVETAGIVSLVVNQSTALQKEVYLFERIDNPKRESLLHLRCVAFLRPTHENFRLLAAELADPKYREYHLCLLRLLFSFLFSCFHFDESSHEMQSSQTRRQRDSWRSLHRRMSTVW